MWHLDYICIKVRVVWFNQITISMAKVGVFTTFVIFFQINQNYVKPETIISVGKSWISCHSVHVYEINFSENMELKVKFPLMNASISVIYMILLPSIQNNFL